MALISFPTCEQMSSLKAENSTSSYCIWHCINQMHWFMFKYFCFCTFNFWISLLFFHPNRKKNGISGYFSFSDYQWFLTSFHLLIFFDQLTFLNWSERFYEGRSPALSLCFWDCIPFWYAFPSLPYVCIFLRDFCFLFVWFTLIFTCLLI